MAKITDHELQNLRSKALDFTKDPVTRAKNAQRLAKLLLRRHRVDPTQYHIIFETGEIQENTTT